MMERISAQVGEDDVAVASAGALCAEQVNGLGVVMSLASCSLATTGTGPRNSETWNSKASVWRTQARSRLRKAG